MGTLRCSDWLDSRMRESFHVLQSLNPLCYFQAFLIGTFFLFCGSAHREYARRLESRSQKCQVHCFMSGTLANESKEKTNLISFSRGIGKKKYPRFGLTSLRRLSLYHPDLIRVLFSFVSRFLLSFFLSFRSGIVGRCCAFFRKSNCLRV